MDKEVNTIRLNKYLAHCGVCPRRAAVDLVKSGEIKVNESVEKNPFYELKPTDQVFYKGNLVIKEEVKMYILLNKEKNMPIQSEGNKELDVMALMSKKTDIALQAVDPLMTESAGLMIMTNDAHVLDKYNKHVHKTKKLYQVALDKAIEESVKSSWLQEQSLTNDQLNVVGIDFVRDLGQDELGIEINLGSDQALVAAIEILGYKVNKIDRTYFGGLTKKDLKRGWSRFLTEKEIIFLKHF